MIRKDITGQRFGMLLVTGYAYGGKNSHWTCKCDCGAEIVVSMPNLRSGNTTKCNAIEHRDGQNLADITGQKFGRLTVVSIYQKARPRKEDGSQLRTLWNCVCDCGNTCIVDAQNLKSGHTQSCGCYLIDAVSTHHCCSIDIRLYNIWRGMIERCENEKDDSYKDYGGRGITVCEEWHDVTVFFDWAFKNGYVAPLTIERDNVNWNYCPENCRWIPRNQQNWNTRKSIGLKKVIKIREMSKQGISTKIISETLKVNINNIYPIINGKYYKGVNSTKN